MFELFDSYTLDRTWMTIMDIAPSLLLAYRERFEQKGLDPNLSYLRTEEKAVFTERKQRNKQILHYVQQEITRLISIIPIPHLFLLADSEGVVLCLQYPEQMKDSVRGIGLREGVHFSLNNLGVNGVSMAMERQRVVVVKGSEHDVKLFRDWNCVCMPIRVEGKPIGYLDLSFHHSYDIEFSIPLLFPVVDRIERSLSGILPDIQRESIYKSFDEYGLSNREKEAAYGWLMNYSVLRISEEMGIAEGTVRNLLKKVYAKTKISDKGQFIRTFGIFT